MRKSMITQSTIVCLLAVTGASAHAQIAPPIDGTYYSTDIGGSVARGRISESWVGTPPGYGLVGNTVLLSSVDGPAMGTQWELWCASINVQPVLLTDVRDSTVTGEVEWRTEYSGGYFWLSGCGPWSTPGSADFDGNIESMTANTVYVYVNGVVSEVQSQITITASFDPANWPGSCMEMTIEGVTYVGSTEGSPKPEEYPPFMGSDCEPWTPETGAWGNVEGITVDIRPCSQSPVESATWGLVKSLYAE